MATTAKKVAGRTKPSTKVTLQASRVRKVADMVTKYGLTSDDVARILYVIEAERVRLAAITNVVELTNLIVKNLYESNANTNAFTDALLTKLNGIEVEAKDDQSPTEIVTAFTSLVLQVSAAERIAGTETGIRQFSPADVVAMIIQHETTGGGGSSFDTIAQPKAMLSAAAGSTYVAPANLGDPGVLTISDWGSFKSATILLDQGSEYDNGANDFVLEIVDQSGDSNSWDPSDNDPAFDLVIPTGVRAWDGGGSTLGSQELAVYGVSEAAQDNAPAPAITWSAGTLSIRFGGADLKAKARNVITITA